jgi:ATP-dependent RNA helicase DeaD
VWFSLSEGRNQAASPRYLLPMVCKAGDLTKDDIGAIRIADDKSYIEIREESVPGFLQAIGPGMTVEGSKKLERLNAAPDLPAFQHGKPNRGPKGRSGPPRANTPPVEWNDTPEPRKRKPKPEDRTPKPEARKDAKPAPRKREAEPADPAVHRPVGKPKHKARVGKFSSEDAPKGGDAKPSRKPRTKTAGKGSPPPKGKPSSKKNRARAAARQVTKGENARPKRK